MSKVNKGPYWLICDRGVCLYQEKATVQERCIKHGAILTYARWLTGLDRKSARQRVKESCA